MSFFAHMADAARKHPAILLGGTAAVILLVMVRSGGKTATAGASGVYAMMSDPTAVAANTQLVLAQDALSANGATLAAQVQMNSDNNAAALANSQIQGNVNSQYIAATQDVSNNQTAAISTITQGQTSAAQSVALAQTSAAQTVALAQTSAAQTVSLAQTAATLQQSTLAAQTQQMADAIGLKEAAFGTLASMASLMPANEAVVNNAVNSLVPNSGGTFWAGAATTQAQDNFGARLWNGQ